jgi:NAD(P)-dependent dehydrogenase (short-subunit alcohol dehydrogenase family)
MAFFRQGASVASTDAPERQRRRKPATVERDFFRAIRPTSLLKRFETTEEVAAMVVYVCSPRASGTNGAVLRVEGGVVRSIV